MYHGHGRCTKSARIVRCASASHGVEAESFALFDVARTMV